LSNGEIIVILECVVAIVFYQVKKRRIYAFREGLAGISAWFCEMPRDKKDLQQEQIYSGSMKAYILSGSVG